jgi:23S rRNA (uridine2552-2'-O)-methyltransferase
MSNNRRTRKTSDWAGKQNKDQFVKKARQQGLRARSAFKLEQIDQKYRLIRPGSLVVDLGATPGSWCQYAVKKVKGKESVYAVDLLPMEEIEGVRFIHGDFTDAETLDTLRSFIADRKLDLVLSDMAPNITGIRVSDQAKAEMLQIAIFEFCLLSLRPGGNLLTKIFEGESAGSVKKMYARNFKQVQIIKPEASRSESREVYILARDFYLSE